MDKYYSEMTWQERRDHRNDMVKIQGGLCYYCGLPLSGQPKDKPMINWNMFPKNFLRHPIHLHHDHNTDICIGAVHAYCNAVLWQYHGE